MLQLPVVLLVTVVAVPLAAALIVPFLRRPLVLLPWAALPGLACALVTPLGTRADLPMLVIGMSLELDRTAAVFLGFGSLLWLLAGIYAGGYMTRSRRLPSFVVFWLLTLAGTLTTFVAADVATFYVGFSMMSLAAFGLVVHDRTPAAGRAGRIYIILAVLGETAMLGGLMLAATHTESLRFADIQAVLSASPWGGVALAGLVVGLGMKAGLAPLHVWLPLAHPQAPTPASAVLSGVIVKAGIIGLIRLLPVDAAPAWGDLLIVLGLGTAYYGVLCGLMQKDPKAMLAYSTMSQMGIVVTLLGAAVGVADPARNLDAAALYATHHGLAKGALFLAIGVVAAAGSRGFRLFALGLTGFAAFAIAGLPFTGGAIAKLAIKTPIGTGTAALLVSLSAVGTGLLMIRFLWALARPAADEPGYADHAPAAGVSWRLSVPWAASVAAALLVPAFLFAELAGYTFGVLASPANLRDAGWPILVAIIIALAAHRFWRGRVPSLPQGDLVVVGEALAGRVEAAFFRSSSALERAPRIRQQMTADGLTALLVRVERHLQRWTLTGPMLVLLVVALAAALMR
jgi:formate hydrogenlyase subunit 3/multisubunit Na+/H+ antiporter MnhD subunit